MMKVSCVLLAAGDSSRMGGRNKLMLEVHGETLIKKTLKEITQVPLHDVIVVTGHESERIAEELRGMRHRIIHNPDYLMGMHASIRAGVKNLKPDTEAFFICLADQPYFAHANLKTLMDEFQGGLGVPVFDGKRGHPVLISSKYIPEILQEPDGDYGCAYLLKRHPHEVHPVPMSSSGILTDIDTPEAYARILEKEYDQKDPVEVFFAKTVELRQSGAAFAVATVIEVMGSASARTGSKAIFTPDGKNILGWVGGGCAERFIGEQSTEAIKEGKTRVVLADLDDEIFGLGVACGGKMRVFIDPVVPSEVVALPDAPAFQNEIRSLSGFYGWNVKKDMNLKTPSSMKELLLGMTEIVAKNRSRKPLPLREVKKAPATFIQTPKIKTKDVTIVGRTRITEALARHFTLLNFNIRAIGPDVKQEDYPSSVQCHCLDGSYGSVQFREGEIVIIAGHTSQDAELVKRALAAKTAYVGMIGSLKRSHEVLTHLDLMNQDVTVPLFIPAGLDMDARNPDEIALSVVAEVLTFEDRNI